MTNEELLEAHEIADRIAVMNRGRLVGIVPAGTPREVLGLMMAGIPEEEARAGAARPSPSQQPADPRTQEGEQ